MSDPRHRYITLVCSLPHLGPLFSRAEVPISAFRLRQRLTSMLEPQHALLLKRLLDATAWTGVAKLKEDAEVIRLAKDVVADFEDYPTLRDLASVRMETRTVIAALRRRAEGQESAGDVAAWGFGRWCGHIHDNWGDPGFGLAHIMPWIPEAHRKMAAGDHIGFERLVLTEVFGQLDRLGAAHDFDFEAVAIYALRWIIVERWSRYNAEAAHDRLACLVQAALSPDATPSTAPAGPPDDFAPRTPAPLEDAFS